ncbi:MAG: hypothetical protein HIU83_16125 [Proteobacteria bacterium]|nr:hypothetical protein [Pseudomonadota bacterium]
MQILKCYFNTFVEWLVFNGSFFPAVRKRENFYSRLEEYGVRALKGLTFIEVILDRTDCNKALLGWGTAVADDNGGKGKAAG